MQKQSRTRARSLTLVPLISAGLLLASCGGTVQNPVISSNPIAGAVSTIAGTQLGGTVLQGLKDAEFNLDSAIAIKVLPANDPADLCVHEALTAIGQEGPSANAPPIPSFTAKNSDLISGGSIVYILAHQVKSAAGSIVIPVDCKTLVGEFVLSGINAPANAVISAVVGAAP